MGARGAGPRTVQNTPAIEPELLCAAVDAEPYDAARYDAGGRAPRAGQVPPAPANPIC
jgi:hypothetical protein